MITDSETDVERCERLAAEFGPEWTLLELLAEASLVHARTVLREIGPTWELNTDRLLGLALHHRLLPTVGAVADVPPVVDADPKVRLFLLHQLQVSRHRHQIMAGLAAELLDAAASHGLAVVATKGVTLHDRVYDGDGTRWYVDVDLMGDLNDAHDIGQVLDTVGGVVGTIDPLGQSIEPLPREDAFAYALSPDHLPVRIFATRDLAIPWVRVDVAMSLTWDRAPWPLAPRRSWLEVPRDGGLATLPPPAHYLFVVLHLFREAWFERTFRRTTLSQVRDVRSIWRALGSQERTTVADLTRELAIEAPVSWALGHIDGMFGSNVVEELGLEPPTDEWLQSARGSGDRSLRCAGDFRTRLVRRGDVPTASV